ncbi:MAG: site-specific integrase, partial [Massilia sp.]
MATTVDLSLIDEFCDTLWLEQGLAKNSLDAYRRDMRLFATWLHARQPERGLLGVGADDLAAYFAERHPDSRPSTANRRLSVLKRFYGLALRRNRIDVDPCLKMASARQPTRFVH